MTADPASPSAAFSLVARHADFVVLDKAPGISFHSEQGPGLVVLAEKTLGQPLYPVHRLDKVTSGLLLLATHAAAAAALTELFRQRKVEKFYLALSLQKPKQKQGWVKGDMVPARRGAYKLLTTAGNPALTYFISAGFDPVPADLPAGARLFLLKPLTGKTHQLRVALKSQGAPIAGDLLYQGDTADRVYLHACALRFDWQGESMQFFCPPTAGQWFAHPRVVRQLDEHWAQPWLLSWPQPKNMAAFAAGEEDDV